MKMEVNNIIQRATNISFVNNSILSSSSCLDYSLTYFIAYINTLHPLNPVTSFLNNIFY